MIRSKLIILLTICVLLIITANPSLAVSATAGGKVRNLVNKKTLQVKASIGTGLVTTKNDTVLTISKDGKNFTVNTDSNTKFRLHFWGKADFSEVQIGDEVNIIGRWTDDSQTTILARVIRDLTLQRRHGVFIGKITSLTSDGWVMETKNRGTLTVSVTSTTKFVEKDKAITKTDIKIGDRVRVRGLWNKTNKTLTEVTHVKKYSLSTKSTPSLTPTP